MSWTSMHFAVGMSAGAVIGGVSCLIVRRGWRFIPGLMTVCGMWALVPDMPRLWREDFNWLPFAGTLGSMSLERWLHHWGDLFFFHKQLDAQPSEYALHGLILIILQYNLALVGLMWLERKQRNSMGNRMYRAHGPRIKRRHATHQESDAPPVPVPDIRLVRADDAPPPPNNTARNEADGKTPARNGPLHLKITG